jgi:protein-L-isoaspartate(D-aspartate) O-methyltransferase
LRFLPKPFGSDPPPSSPEDFTALRLAMVEKQIAQRGIKDSAVLDAMRAVPRHEFVPAQFRSRAYDDAPLPIGQDQTISQPYIVAAMTTALSLNPGDSVLEIGTGSAYQTAILSRLAARVYSIERREALAKSAAARLAGLGYGNVHVFERDGSGGLPEFAPYDAILVTAGAPRTPQPLLDQLAEGGRMVLPVGAAERQQLLLIERTGNSFLTRQLDPCQFVPLIGYYGWPENPAR